MTVGDLRRFLNTLPLDSDKWPITILDRDTAELFDVVSASRGSNGGRPVTVIAVKIAE